MTDTPATPEAAEAVDAETTDEAPRQPSPMVGVIKAIALISSIVVVEVVAASMLIPSAEDTQRFAEEYVAASEGNAAPTSHGDSDGHSVDEHIEDIHEVEMGTFNVTHFNPATSTTISIDFVLFGAVLAKNEEDFLKLFEKNKIRVREQVIMILHGAQSKDLSDSGLGLIKRQILEKTNRALGQPLLREVLFSKFNFVER